MDLHSQRKNQQTLLKLTVSFTKAGIFYRFRWTDLPACTYVCICNPCSFHFFYLLQGGTSGQVPDFTCFSSQGTTKIFNFWDPIKGSEPTWTNAKPLRQKTADNSTVAVVWKEREKREMSYFLMVISSAHFITSHVVLHRTSRHLSSNTWLFPLSHSSWKGLIIISSHTQIHRIFFNLHANKMFILKSPFSCCGFNSRIFFTTQSDGDLGLKW